MIFVIAFGALVFGFIGLSWYERRKGLHTKGSEADTYAMTNGAGYGAVVGQAQMSKLGIQADEVTQREEHEPVKFKFED